MSSSAKISRTCISGSGGTEIWRIENFQPVPLPKSDYGKFYSGDSYIILQTSPGKGGAYLYDIHFWLGKDTSQDEAGTAAIKTVELDAVLGGRAVQYRELQGHESDKFLSYFKPCIIPLEGGVASGFKKPEEEESHFSRSSLNHDDVFILDTKDKIYQFNGANSNIQERAKALEVIQFLKEKYHEGKCDVAIVDDGKLQAETDSGEFWVLFGVVCSNRIIDGQVKSVDGELSKSILENNKCYLLDCGAEQGGVMKGASKSAPVNEDVPPLLEGGGKTEVWRIDGSAKTPVPSEDIGKFYSGDCYIVLYTYHSHERKEDYYLCSWIGKDSIEGRIFQGKEPPQFVAIFQPMVILKGGMSSGYKNYIADKGLNDETYTACWHGNQGAFEQQQLAVKIAEFLKPGSTIKHTKEGTESSSFWFALGGKQSYTSKKVSFEVVRDPHLFAFSFNKGKFEVEEIYNFSQDDLLTEDILILDTHAEVFVWVGQSVDSKEKQNAFEIGQVKLVKGYDMHVDVDNTDGEMVTLWDTLHAYPTLAHLRTFVENAYFYAYVFMLTNVPSFQKQAHGNSFQKKVMLLFGAGHEFNFISKSFFCPRSGGKGQGSQRAAAVAALSSVLTAEQKRSPDVSPARSSRGPPSEASPPASVKSEDAFEIEDSKEVSKVNETETVEPAPETNGGDTGSKPEIDQDENVSESSQSTFSYDQLRAKSDNPVTGIDFKRREAYLSVKNSSQCWE
ncbi:hypothetical protein DH2020_041406 [Rehmannia glutinosa]|uniref:Gelsolin-like domain-containing protein n=1 Tax=Rehmannia glutinosa TaxID=99300 RepID=A0ABR0URE1_REHGL